jgi:hypothetical protein
MHALPPSATPTALRVRHSQNRKAEGKFQHRGPSAPTRGGHRRPGLATSSRCKLPMTDFPVSSTNPHGARLGVTDRAIILVRCTLHFRTGSKRRLPQRNSNRRFTSDSGHHQHGGWEGLDDRADIGGKPPRIGLQNGSAAFCNLGYVRVASIERPARGQGHRIASLLRCPSLLLGGAHGRQFRAPNFLF